MAWLVWSGIGLFVGVLLAVSWWFDRDARRRGATPLAAGEMVGRTRDRRWDTVRRGSQLIQGGATPRSQDAHAETWRREPPGRG